MPPSSESEIINNKIILRNAYLNIINADVG